MLGNVCAPLSDPSAFVPDATEKMVIILLMPGANMLESVLSGQTIAVGDTGLGIPAGKLRDIFDQFTQADSSTTRKHGGTGPGHLPAARQAHAR